MKKSFEYRYTDSSTHSWSCQCEPITKVDSLRFRWLRKKKEKKITRIQRKGEKPKKMKNTKPASNEQLFDCNENKRKKGGLFYENSLTKAGSDQIIFFF